MNKQYKFGCECCKYYTNLKTRYEMHLTSKKHLLKAKNELETPFECPFCKKSFQTNSGLWRHKNKCNQSVRNTIINKTTQTKITDEKLIKIQEKFDKKLLQSEEEYRKQISALNREKENVREMAILRHFPKNIQCVYYGVIDDVSKDNEKLIKLGSSNNLQLRILQHRNTYTNFRLVNAFKVQNKVEIESAIKQNQLLAQYRRKITLNGKNHNELFAYNNVSFEKIDNIIQESIEVCEFTVENYKKLLEENKQLKGKVCSLKKKIVNLKKYFIRKMKF